MKGISLNQIKDLFLSEFYFQELVSWFSWIWLRYHTHYVADFVDSALEVYKNK